MIINLFPVNLVENTPPKKKRMIKSENSFYIPVVATNSGCHYQYLFILLSEKPVRKRGYRQNIYF